MREIRTHHWCDACYDDGERYVEAAATTRLALTRTGIPQPRTLDLCPTHTTQLLDPLRELLAEHGRKADGLLLPAAPRRSATTPTATPSATPAAIPTVDAAKSWACPICVTTVRRSYAADHVWRFHRRGEQRPSGTVCPECGETFTRPQGLGSHRERKHQVDSLTEALAGVH